MQKCRTVDLVLQLAVLVVLEYATVNCDLCIPSQHRTYSVDDMKNVLGGKSLAKNDLFRSAVLNKEKSKLIVGGKDSLAVLDATTLKITHEESWKVDNGRCLGQSQVSKDYCNNYITHLSIYKDNLVACGTGSLKPVYKVFSLDTMSTIKVVQRFGVCASPNPNHRVVGQITSLGEMIAGTFFDVGGKKSDVVGSYMTEKMSVYRENLETTVSDINKDLEFIKSFYIKDSVYVFFMETAEERNNEFTATIGRFCQTDNGAQAFISSQHWTTFRKTRLNCRYEGKTDKNTFKYLVDIVYDEKKKLFYATYMMTRQVNLASAICTFDFDEVESSFNNNKFMKKDQKTNKWTVIDGPPFLIGCSVNKTFLESGTVLTTSVGKEPTDSLNTEASTFMAKNRLMAVQVYSKPNIFQYVKPATRLTKMTLDKIPIGNGDEETMINVIDDKGNILMLHQMGSNKKPCVIEEIQTGIKEPSIFIMNQEKRLLYVSSSTASELHVINVDSCQRHNTKNRCLDANNIRCGWSIVKAKCISTYENRGNLTLVQNITNSCPMENDIYSSWSPWKAEKQQDGSSKYCLTRQRECRSCDKALCDKEHVEVTNCTANEVTDVAGWFINGSVDGSWSHWEEWSDCQIQGKCGNATMIRYRQCSSPSPENGGRKCLGSNFECSTCPKEKEFTHVFWSEWGSWTNSQQTDNQYRQQRTRICSKPNQCHGEDVEYIECPTSGILWGKWSRCTCQSIQHRFPLCISGCGENCLRLKQPEYRMCQPVGCPTATPKKTNTTTNETDTKIEVIYPSNGAPTQKCQDGYTFKLIELISIGIGIIASCFVIVVVIVLLLIRRDRKKNSFSPHEIRKTKSQPLLEQTDTLDSNSRESNA